MLKTLIAVLIAMWSWNAAAQDADSSQAVVDLNSPGALAALAQNNPAHYRKVVQILDEVRTQQPADVPQWLATKFDAREVFYTSILLISNPPKRNLSFVLDHARYRARVTLDRITIESFR